jgi:hypothetical protein
MRDGAGWTLFLDFGGTLVEIAERPEAVVVEPGLTRASPGTAPFTTASRQSLAPSPARAGTGPASSASATGNGGCGPLDYSGR